MSILGLVVWLVIGAWSKEELIVNGDFEQPLSNGWTEETEGTWSSIMQSPYYDGDEDYEVKVSTEAGPHCETYAYLWQTVNTPNPHIVEFSGKAKFETVAYQSEGSWAVAQLIVVYADAGGNYLGDTRMYNYPYGSWQSDATHHAIEIAGGVWNEFSFNVGEEVDNNLSGVNSANVKKVQIKITANGFGAQICIGKDATATTYADEISVRTETGVEEEKISVDGIHFSQVSPNPFGEKTEIRYQLEGQKKPISLKVYSLSGNLIETLIDEEQEPGCYATHWNAKNIPSGIYFIQLKTERFEDTRKAIIMR